MRLHRNVNPFTSGCKKWHTTGKVKAQPFPVFSWFQWSFNKLQKNRIGLHFFPCHTGGVYTFSHSPLFFLTLVSDGTVGFRFRCSAWQSIDSRTICNGGQKWNRLCLTEGHQNPPYIENIPPKGVIFSNFICIFAMSVKCFLVYFLQNPEKLNVT